MTAERFDFLVIGGGIAGLTFALRAAEHGTVALLCKRSLNDAATSWAQGGIATAWAPDDSPELHFKDTLATGAGLCNENTVRIAVEEGPQRIRELIERGVRFDRDSSSGELHLTREGGHSQRRVLHTADATGAEIQRALVQTTRAHKNIKIFEGAFAIDLITSRKIGSGENSVNTAIGAYVLQPSGEIVPFLASRVLVASGGAGKVYLYTSNPDVATGDGIAMCFRAGVPVANMEFFQFHPTCLYHPLAKSFLITEAMRGEGARLRRANGELFMHKYDAREELAPRDVVARAIDHQLKATGDDYVLLDITHKSPAFIRDHFPGIQERCLKFGYDICTQPIPVVPAAHYCCGGVVCDSDGATNIRNLYVAGECAHTGLHGANRLASNSLLEGAVFGHRAAEKAIIDLPKFPLHRDVPEWNSGQARDSDEQVVITQLWDEIRRNMWNYVGIVRSTKRLERALRRSTLIENETTEYYWDFRVTTDLLELRNLSLVSNIIIHSALRRPESRGLHYNVDHPHARDSLARDTVIYPEEWFHYAKVGAYRH